MKRSRKNHNHNHDITRTCVYNFDPLKPHFYIVKLVFTGVYIIFLILLKNIGCGYSLGGSNEYPKPVFWAEIWKKKKKNFYLKIFNFWRWIFLYIWISVFLTLWVWEGLRFVLFSYFFFVMKEEPFWEKRWGINNDTPQWHNCNNRYTKGKKKNCKRGTASERSTKIPLSMQG